ncbi:kynurenine formamidase [Pelodytes ibericus]
MARESWRRLGREELEHQYSPSHWSQRMDKDVVIEAHVKETTEGTRLSRTVTQTVLNIPYGDTESEKLDLYLPQGSSVGYLFIYIHGGYWQFLSKEESGFMVPPLVSHNIAVMVMDYDIAPQGHMDLMVAQIRRSIAVTLTQYPQITDVYLCGHSAGAHLVAMALCTDWSEFKVSPCIKGAILVSGIYDLHPIIHTYVNDAMGMSQEVAERNSPINLVPHIKHHASTCHISIVVAEHDSFEFHRQSKEYFQSLKAAGLHVCFTQIEATDHFDVIERLSHEEYELTQMILEMIVKKVTEIGFSFELITCVTMSDLINQSDDIEKRYNDVLKYLSLGELPSNYNYSQRYNFRKTAGKYTLKDGELFHGRRTVVKSGEEAKRLFAQIHNSDLGGHSGTIKTRMAITRRFFWHGMCVDIEKWISECDECQKVGRPLIAPQPLQCIKVSDVWELVGIDLIGPLIKSNNGYSYILTATDYFSKWVEAFPMKTKSAAEVARNLCSMIYRHGCPKRILSDQGREFVNKCSQKIVD